MRLEYEVKDTGVGRALDSLAYRTANMAPAMRTIANLQMKSTMHNFETESFDGIGWPGLARSTAMRRVNTVAGLVSSYAGTPRRSRATGGLLRLPTTEQVVSYEQRVRKERSAEGRGSRRRLTRVGGRNRVRGYSNILHPTGRHLLQRIHQSSSADEARVSSGTTWAWVHNFGATIGRLRMPQRTFMGITDDDVANMETAVWAHVWKGQR